MIREFIKDVLKINDGETTVKIINVLKPVSFKKGDVLVKEGQCDPPVMFLQSGIVRGYFYDPWGKDYTECLAHELFTPIISTNGIEEVSSMSFEALTDSNVFAVSNQIARAMVKNIPEVKDFYTRSYEQALVYHRELRLMQYLPAVEKYIWFKNNFPGLADRIQQQYIASHLGITKEHLSRVRRQIDGQ